MARVWWTKWRWVACTSNAKTEEEKIEWTHRFDIRVNYHKGDNVAVDASVRNVENFGNRTTSERSILPLYFDGMNVVRGQMENQHAVSPRYDEIQLCVCNEEEWTIWSHSKLIVSLFSPSLFLPSSLVVIFELLYLFRAMKALRNCHLLRRNCVSAIRQVWFGSLFAISKIESCFSITSNVRETRAAVAPSTFD